MIRRVGLQTVPNNMMDFIIVYTLAVKHLAQAKSKMSHITLTLQCQKILQQASGMNAKDFIVRSLTNPAQVSNESLMSSVGSRVRSFAFSSSPDLFTEAPLYYSQPSLAGEGSREFAFSICANDLSEAIIYLQKLQKHQLTYLLQNCF